MTLRGSQNMNAGVAACTNLTGALTGAAARVTYLQAASLTVTMSGCATLAGITRVTITVGYPFVFTVALFGTVDPQITETAQALFN